MLVDSRVIEKRDYPTVVLEGILFMSDWNMFEKGQGRGKDSKQVRGRWGISRAL